MYDAIMRTTLTLDPDVAERLKQELVISNKSFKALLNDTLRRGLGMEPPPRKKRFIVRPHSSPFVAGIDPGRLNQAVDKLEVLEFQRRHAGRE